MSKFIKAAAGAAFLLLGTTTLIAQQKDGNAPVDKKVEKNETPPAAKTAPGGAVKDEKSTDPAAPKQGEIKKLDKEGRGGQQN